MMHAIGKLYVLTRAAAHPEFFAERTVLDQILEEWHPSIGKAILENWEFSENDARKRSPSRTTWHAPSPTGADLSDVARNRRIDGAALRADSPALQTALDGLPGASRLGLNEARIARVMADSASEVAALSEALGALKDRGDRRGDVAHVVGHDAREVHAAVGCHVDVMSRAERLHRCARHAQQ